MSGVVCNYQRKITQKDLSAALAQAVCQHCGVTARELKERGEFMDVCAEEFASDIVTGERLLAPLALCPECHRKFHLDANNNHNPCQIKARMSREGLL